MAQGYLARPAEWHLEGFEVILRIPPSVHLNEPNQLADRAPTNSHSNIATRQKETT